MRVLEFDWSRTTCWVQSLCFSSCPSCKIYSRLLDFWIWICTGVQVRCWDLPSFSWICSWRHLHGFDMPSRFLGPKLLLVLYNLLMLSFANYSWCFITPICCPCYFRLAWITRRGPRLLWYYLDLTPHPHQSWYPYEYICRPISSL